VKLVFDSPPLQALHRAGALALLERACDEVCVPGAVADETRASLAASGAARVPELHLYSWIQIFQFTDEELAAAGATPLRERRGTVRYRFGGRQIGRPALEAVLLAARRGGTAVVEDRPGVAGALAAGVPVVDTAWILRDLEARHFLDDAPARARTILATGYFSSSLRALSHGFPAR
jgi:hypothetical protein